MSVAPDEDGYRALRADLHRRFVRKSPEHADDLTQDALLRIHRSLPELREADRLDVWVARVVRAVWVDHLRRRRPTEPFEEAADAPVEDDLELETVAGWLPHFVDALPEPYAAAVRAVDLEGTSQADLARQLGISGSGVRSRVQRGRALLKERLAACCEVRWEDGEIVDVERRCGC